MNQNEFEKAWHLAYADRAVGVNPPNWNGWDNEIQNSLNPSEMAGFYYIDILPLIPYNDSRIKTRN